MEWVFLEVFIALAIAIAIVWWTMTPTKKRDVNQDVAATKADPEEKEKS